MDETVIQVSASPAVYVLTLPDGCCPGRMEAAQSFAEAVQFLQSKEPGKHFQYIPFDQDTLGGLKAMLAIET